MAPHIPASVDAKLLGLYLSDHLAGATAGVGRIERMAKDFTDTPVRGQLEGLVVDLRRERARDARSRRADMGIHPGAVR
jgi:hypothetical protein